MTEDRFHTDKDGDRSIEEIAEELGEVAVSDGFLEETEVEKGEQFGYEK